VAKDGLEALFDVPPLTCYSNLLKSYRCEEPFPTFALRILEGQCCALYDPVCCSFWRLHLCPRTASSNPVGLAANALV